jgi:hypothetical protein
MSDMRHGAELESQLKLAVRTVMTATTPTPQQVGKVQELVERKAEQIRAPISEKVARLKAAG